jgi:hypothetical protein
LQLGERVSLSFALLSSFNDILTPRLQSDTYKLARDRWEAIFDTAKGQFDPEKDDTIHLVMTRFDDDGEDEVDRDDDGDEVEADLKRPSGDDSMKTRSKAKASAPNDGKATKRKSANLVEKTFNAAIHREWTRPVSFLVFQSDATDWL